MQKKNPSLVGKRTITQRQKYSYNKGRKLEKKREHERKKYRKSLVEKRKKINILKRGKIEGKEERIEGRRKTSE